MKLIKLLNNLKLKALENNEKGIEVVINASITNRERIFSILNKIDKIWTRNSELQFCEIIKMINTDKYINDLELTKSLDALIDGNSTT